MSFIYQNLDCVGYLLVNRIQLINANAISSPLTYGFPAISGFAGAIHALSRKISQIDGLEDVRLDGVLIACFDCQPQVYRESSYKDYSFIQTRNPIKKDGKTAPIIEEGRCHLTVSLAIGVYYDGLFFDEEQADLLTKTVKERIYQQRIAGGSVMGLDNACPVQFFEDKDIHKMTAKLLPAFVLTACDDLDDISKGLADNDPAATALDALLETAVLRHRPDNEVGDHWTTTSIKQGRGWLVPIPVGYQAISPLFEKEQLQNSRNPAYKSQYVECIYGLGKWVFPYSLHDLSSALWYQKYDSDNGLYLLTHKDT